MEIHDIKSRLTLSTLIKHYGLKADKQGRMCCPFHEDKTPSMQLYYKTNTAYCFSANCRTHGKSMDVIDFIMYMENCSKHEALLKAQTWIDGNAIPPKTKIQTKKLSPMSGIAVLTKMFSYFKNAVNNSHPAQEYIKSRALAYLPKGGHDIKLEIGYNSGQFHHGNRKEEALIQSCLEIGLLKDENIVSRTGEKAYKPFGKWGIVFALRNKEHQVTGMYFRSTLNNDKAKHYYLKDREGLYPGYPKAETKKLILTEAIIDAATLMQLTIISSQFTILSCFGTNGLTGEHIEAIKALQHLEEIIFFFDGDEAGRKGVEKYAAQLQKEMPHCQLSAVNCPEGEDINSLAQSHSSDILLHLIGERKEFFLSTENILSVEKEKQSAPTIVNSKPETLNTSNPFNLVYEGKEARHKVRGGIKPQLDSLRISLQIINRQTKEDHRAKIDLYEYKQIEALAQHTADRLKLRADLLEKELSVLTNLLEEYRDNQQKQSQGKNNENPVRRISEAAQTKSIQFLKKPGVIKNIGTLIGKSGVTGEENNRLFLFVIASSYKMKNTLHALIQGSSGSGKTRLLKVISELMPMEDVKKYTRVTDSSFYNQDEYFFVNKLICFEDYDGLKDDAQLAVRELQSNEILISSTSIKDESGKISGGEKIVRGPIASMACTTRGEIYEDNISRCFVIAVDESSEQTQRVISYQNDVAAGIIDKKKEREVREFLQNCVRLLKPYEVVNPFANKIQLPPEAHKIRRLNELYQCLVGQITIINQYQRQKDQEGRLISEKEDLQTACDIMFESILLKVDELDGGIRQFYEQLKTYVQSKGKEYEFNRFEIRQATGVSKTQQHVYINRLVALEYVQQHGYANRGFKYKITHWDNIQELRKKIKQNLESQLNTL